MFNQISKFGFFILTLFFVQSITLSAQHIEPNGVQVTGGSNMALLGGGTCDMAVNASMCLGMDCFVGVLFDTSTLLLRENNLRIKFEDTSLSASFPSWDWELIGNLNGEGSPEEFLIYDATSNRFPVRIKGGTPSNTIVVDSTGNLGLGTLTPQETVHIRRPTVRVRLDQNGSMGYSPMIWDLAADATEFAIYNVTNGTKVFRIGAGAGEHSFVINSAGYTGFGTDQPSEKMQVVGHVKVNGNMHVTGVPIISDLRLKTDIEPLENVLSVLKKVNVVSFDFEDQTLNGSFPKGHRFGFIAQEVNLVLPQLTGRTTIAGAEYQTVDYLSFVPIVLAGTQEINEFQKTLHLNLSAQEQILETQDHAIDILKKELNELKALIVQAQQ